MTDNIEIRVQNLIENVIMELGYSLYDVLYVKEGKDFYLRIIIDKANGISIEDCEKVNNAINSILDKADYIKEQYFLEVSSPGVERTLRKEKHFKDQIGNEIFVKLFKQIDGEKELIGILKEYNNKDIIVQVNKKNIQIELKNIALAKTVYWKL